LFDRILVEKAKPQKMVGGIVLPESAAQKLNYGVVVEVGQGKFVNGQLQPLTVKKGDTVMLGEWGGNTVKVNDKEFLMVREDEVLGIVELEK
jgi:chaperonin GroES